MSACGDVGDLKWLNKKLTSLPLRNISLLINIRLNNIKEATPLAWGHVLVELTSRESLNKALAMSKFDMGASCVSARGNDLRGSGPWHIS